MTALGSEQSFAALGMNDCYADNADRHIRAFW